MTKKDKKLINDWLPQSSFIIAINNESINSFESTCSTFEIRPSLTFKSSISGEEVSYAKFDIDDPNAPITDIRMCYVIQSCLKALFNTYSNIRSLVKASKEELIIFPKLLNDNDKITTSEECSSYINIPYLLYAACFSIRKQASKGNEAKSLNAFLKAINLNATATDSLIQIEKRTPFNKSTDSPDDYIYILEQNSENVLFTFTTTAPDFMSYLKRGTKPKAHVTELEASTPIKETTTDISSLIANNSNCMLLRELHSGKRKLSMSELVHLAKSLCGITGAQSAIKESIQNTGLYNDTVASLIDYLISLYRKNGYAKQPPLCSLSCYYHENCSSDIGHRVNYLNDILEQKIGTIRHINNHEKHFRDKETIRAEIIDCFDQDCNCEDNKIFVYKCFVGLGKTFMYLAKIQEFIKNNKTVIIAIPTHELKDDICSRLSEHLSQELISEKVINVPRIPQIDDEFKETLNSFYAVGDYTGAKKYIKRYQAELDSTYKSDSIKEDLDSYIDITESLKDNSFTKGKIIITTHERLFSLKSINPDIVIIDEDITDSVLKMGQVNVEELRALRLKITNLIKGGANNLDDVVKKLDNILKADNKILYTLEADTNTNIRTFLLKEISADKGTYYNSKIIDLLFNNCIYVNSSGKAGKIIHFVYKRDLPFNSNDCKIFIMSATSDKEICTQLFGQENVIFREFDIPKLEASITMNHKYSFSNMWFKKRVKKLRVKRPSIKKLSIKKPSVKKLRVKKPSLQEHTKFLERIRDFHFSKIERKFVPRTTKLQPLIITFKEYEKDFKSLDFDTSMHFGNTTGIDSYKHQKVAAVFGTYNLPATAYALYTKAIFPDEPIYKVPEYSRVLVSNKDYKFYIHTSEEFSKFRKIQLWKIESETIQALGRARPIDNKCLIRIYSNVPPSGIEITFI